jgi:hypothetical protein
MEGSRQGNFFFSHLQIWNRDSQNKCRFDEQCIGGDFGLVNIECAEISTGFYICERVDVVLRLGAAWMTIFWSNKGLNMNCWFRGTARL